MVENRESESQESKDRDPVTPNPSQKQRIDAKMKAQLSPENEIRVTPGESLVEIQSIAGQTSGQMSASGSIGPTIGLSDQELQELQQKNDVELDQKIQELTAEEELRVKQGLQKAREELQQIRSDTSKTPTKSDDQPVHSSGNSSTNHSEADQDDEYYQGYGY